MELEFVAGVGWVVAALIEDFTQGPTRGPRGASAEVLGIRIFQADSLSKRKFYPLLCRDSEVASLVSGLLEERFR